MICDNMPEKSHTQLDKNPGMIANHVQFIPYLHEEFRLEIFMRTFIDNPEKTL